MMKPILLLLSLLVSVVALSQTKNVKVYVNTTEKTHEGKAVQKDDKGTYIWKQVKDSATIAENTLSPVPIDSATNKVLFREVVEVAGDTKDALYIKARLWFVNTFGSADEVLQMEDKEAGILVGKGFSKIYVNLIGAPNEMKMWYTIKISIKDGKYKAEISNIWYEGEANQYNGYKAPKSYAEDVITDEHAYKDSGKPKKLHASYREQTISKASELLLSIKKAMTKKSSGNDGW